MARQPDKRKAIFVSGVNFVTQEIAAITEYADNTERRSILFNRRWLHRISLQRFLVGIHMPRVTMTEKEFWSWVDQVQDSLFDDSAIEKEVRSLSVLYVVWMDHWHMVMSGRLLTWPLWDFLEMAFDGSFGDESFDEFRPWLVYQGEKANQAAVENPDTLVPVLRGKSRYEMFQGDAVYNIVLQYLKSRHEEVDALSPDLLPPEFTWPELSGNYTPEEEWQQHFPIGYQEYIVEGKVFE